MAAVADVVEAAVGAVLAAQHRQAVEGNTLGGAGCVVVNTLKDRLGAGVQGDTGIMVARISAR